MKKNIILILIALCATINISAQDRNSYNYKRGLELYNEDKSEEAEKLFLQEVSAYPKNIYAQYYLSVIYAEAKEYGKALEHINLAISNAKKDKEWLSTSYLQRSDIYESIDESEKQLSDINAAIKCQPNDEVAYSYRATYYLDNEENEKALSDYEKAIELAPTNYYFYIGKALSLIELNREEEAVECCTYAMKLGGDASITRANAYMKLKRYSEALDDAFYSYSNNHPRQATYLINSVADSAYTLTKVKIKAKIQQYPNNSEWFYLLAEVQEYTSHYTDAIENYRKSIEIGGQSDYEYSRIANCYSELNNLDLALENINKAIEIDTTYATYYLSRADIYSDLGQKNEALLDYAKGIELNPDSYLGYYQRAWFEQYNGMNENAISDLTTAIEYAPNFAHLYMTRGSVFRRMGDTQMANADYRKVIEIEKDSVGQSAMFANFYLGNSEKAEEMLKQLLDKKYDIPGDNYNAACLYSLMNKPDEAIKHLRISLENGYYHFTHIRRDFDLDNIRKMPEFEKLLTEFEEQTNTANKQDATQSAGKLKIVEIPFIKRYSGTMDIKCEINGLPLTFIFDTGASDVSISDVEAKFMLKNGYLSTSDIVGKTYYSIANGDIAEGTNIVLKEVTFGGLALKNIRASVVKGQNAPLLLGQTVMQRLGQIEIDNDKKVIRVKYTE